MTIATDSIGINNPQELAQVLSQIFAPQAITARIAYQPDRWRILLEAPEPPDRRQSLQTLQKFFQTVALPPGLEVYGREAGEEAPAWGVRIQPKIATPVSLSPVGKAAPAPEPVCLVNPLTAVPQAKVEQDPGVGLFVSSLGLLFALATGLWWLSPTTWIQSAPPANSTQIRDLITTIASDVNRRYPLPSPQVDLVPPPPFRGKTINQVSLPPEHKVVALTFDDGPDQPQTLQVLNILKAHKAKATFFVIGRSVQKYPNIAAKIVEEGHTIANHSWSHRYQQFSPQAAATEFTRTDQIIQAVTGVKNYWFRPPGGRLNNGLVDYAKTQQLPILMWSVDSRDWQPGRSPAQIKAAVLQQTRPGGIVLLHDGGGPRQAMIQALPGILTVLKKQGYEFVTIPQLLHLKQESLDPTPPPPAWLGLHSITQVIAAHSQLSQEQATLYQSLVNASPIAIDERETLAAKYQTTQQAVRWVSQRLSMEQQAQQSWDQALNFSQAAMNAVQRGQLKQAKDSWQQTIATLKTVPHQSLMFSQAQAKTEDSQQQLQRVQHQFAQQQSRFLIPLAKSAGLSNNAAVSLCSPNGQCYSLRGDIVPDSAASLIKLPLAVVTLHWAQEHQYSLEHPFAIQPQNNTEDASIIRVGQRYPLKTVIGQMISRSSNIAPNQLMDTLGWDYINRVMQGYGFKTIKIYSKLVGQSRQPANLGRQSNGSSMQELSQLMGKIYQNQLPHAPFLQTVLAQQTDREIGFKALKSTQAEWIGEKTGQNSLVLGTVLAFKVKGEIYTLAIMDRNQVGLSALQNAIRNIVNYATTHNLRS
ncbi:polysaccharide deacetylase family protein [Synechococcus sp. PCC 6312]|uniref:polysaccharide deacetylase family protein n=1 Tax=Synechococcus sp. (strain ATCC 27167 / PCC 6312) TaxID=195253 RepID=UPI00029EF8ED|nr:polysaccharide deacetylase family protein [Synechococcus sp. PCC 6312]AFY59695.1 putative xylanase/chitin deacetylase [Synechococcus sp. PCC 6312]